MSVGSKQRTGQSMWNSDRQAPQNLPVYRPICSVNLGPPVDCDICGQAALTGCNGMHQCLLCLHEGGICLHLVCQDLMADTPEFFLSCLRNGGQGGIPAGLCSALRSATAWSPGPGAISVNDEMHCSPEHVLIANRVNPRVTPSA